jgi:hypothetical protein
MALSERRIIFRGAIKESERYSFTPYASPTTAPGLV